MESPSLWFEYIPSKVHAEAWSLMQLQGEVRAHRRSWAMGLFPHDRESGPCKIGFT